MASTGLRKNFNFESKHNMEKITVQTEISKPIDEVWDLFNNPEHIVNWNFAHESWECPSSSNDLKVGAQLKSRMQAKDGSFGFDLIGIYDEINVNQNLKYHFEDNRNIEVIFEKLADNKTKVIEIFDPETENPVEIQKDGWQAILDNFKKYSESV